MVYFIVFYYRFEDIGDAFAGHSTYVGQCAADMLLCLLHIWYSGCTAMGRHVASEMLHDRQHDRSYQECLIIL